MTRIYHTWLNADQRPKDYEVSFKPSMTIPDQSMSLKEILDRFARGLPLDGEKVGMYHGDEMPVQLQKMDLTEIQELREQLNEQMLKYKQEMADLQEKRNAENQLQLFRKWEQERTNPQDQSKPI